MRKPRDKKIKSDGYDEYLNVSLIVISNVNYICLTPEPFSSAELTLSQSKALEATLHKMNKYLEWKQKEASDD